MTRDAVRATRVSALRRFITLVAHAARREEVIRYQSARSWLNRRVQYRAGADAT